MSPNSTSASARAWRIAALAICSAFLSAVVATSAWATKEYILPSHITIEHQKFDLPNDPHRCVAYDFAEFPVIPRAKGYEVTIADTVNHTRVTESGPPFPDDHWDWFPAHYDVHPHFHWFALSGYSTGTGCTDAILALDGRHKIVRSRVSLERAFQRQLRPPRRGWKIRRCHSRGESPRLGEPGGKLLLVKIGGPQGAIIKSEHTPRSNIATGIWVQEDSILETDRRSAVMIYDKFQGDNVTGEVVVGPGTRVRIEPGKRVEVLHHDPHASWDDVPKIRSAPGDRIDLGCMSARG